jgi:hypothetical protein
MTKAIAWIWCTILLTAPLFAQSEFHRYEIQPLDSNSAALRFERNVNTYLWNANAAYHFRQNGTFVRLDDKFTSSFIRGQYGSYRDEQNFSLRMAHAVSGPYSAVVDVQSFLLSDQQSFGTNNAAIHTGAAGITIQPAQNFSITPMAGVRYDQQQSYSDKGWNYRLYANGDSLEAGDYLMNFNGQLHQSSAGSRRFKNDQASVKIETDFAEGSTDSVRLRWSLNRNDFYVPADSNVLKEFGTSSNIRSRNEQYWGIHNFLSYRIASGITTILEVQVESRSIENAFAYKPLSVLTSIPFNTDVHEFRIQGGWMVEFRTAATAATLGFQIGERNEKHQLQTIDGVDQQYQNDRARQESRLDNIAYRNSLNAALVTEITPDDDLILSGSVGLLQYDTPDTINTDDRDELLINLSLKETHRFNPFFSAALTVEATAAHLVYIHREKSANNNWNRIVRLKPELTYRPSEQLRMFNAFEVLANYTVFDFESYVPSVKSYSYRQVAFLDSTSYDMTRTVGFDVSAYVRVYERGELRWAEFSERPLQRIEEVTLSPQVRYMPNDRWMFAAGFRSFAQKRFTYSNSVRHYESSFISAGPTTAVVISISPLSKVEIRGWKEFQRQSGGKIHDYSNMTMNVRYYF